MRRWVVIAALLTGGCADEELAESAWPSQWTEGGDPVIDAWQVWRLGSDYFADESDATQRDIMELKWPVGWPGTIDMSSKDFLNCPELKPAVQFGCTSRMTTFEWSLKSALEKGSFHERLQAVTLLMKVRAPSSVPEQWRTLQELAPQARGAAGRLLEELKNEFRVEKLLPRLSRPPPSERCSDGESEFCWFIRAAGVVRLEDALPRLRALTREESVYISLAAERSLEDFPGSHGDEALIYCLLGWRYNAAEKAGRALLARDRDRLRAALLGVRAPERYRFQQGLLLAQCDAPEAVPILCETVSTIAIVDKEMFQQIGRLATLDHETFLSSLPGVVREEQRAAAIEAVAQFELRRISAEGR